MEIQNPKPLGDPQVPGAREAGRRAVAKPDSAKEAPTAVGGSDRVEVSERGRLFADDARVDDDGASQAREKRVAELRARVENGTLLTPERAEEAARRMLGS